MVDRDPRSMESEPTTAFPIAEQSVTSTIRLLRALHPRPALLNLHRTDLARDDTVMSGFLDDMLVLREMMDLTDPDTNAYKAGVVFGFNLLKEQFQRRGLVLDRVNISALKAYFTDLLTTGPNPASSEEYVILLDSQPHPIGSIDPMTFIGIQTIGVADNPGITASSAEIFKAKLIEKVSAMWEQEKSLRDKIPELQGLLDEEYSGFAYGLADIYCPHQIDQTIGPFAQVLDGITL